MNERNDKSPIRAGAKWASVSLVALSLAGCAAESLSLAPAAPDVPFKPDTVTATSDQQAAAALAKTTPSGARDFSLPPMPDLQSTYGAALVDPNHVYSLPELIDLAQTNNPETRVAWERARQAALAVGIVKALYLPMLSATAVGGYQHTSGSNQVANLSSSGDFDQRGTVSGAAVQWLLFDFGQRDALKDAAANLSLASNMAFNGVHQKIIYDVSRTFYDYTSARKRVVIAEKTRDESARLKDAAAEKFKTGIATAVDTAQANQLYAQANFNLVQARGAERDIYHSLVAAIGVSPMTTMRVADVSGRPLSPASMVPVEKLVSNAIARRADIQASYAAAKAAHAGIAAAEAEFLPKVFVSASGSYVTGSLNISQLPSLNLGGVGGPSAPVATNSSVNATNATILGGVTMPIFDGGIRDARLRDAQSRNDAAEATLLHLQQNAASEIVTADDALRSSLAAYQAATVLVSASKTTEDAAFSSYKSGTSAITEAIEAEKALLTARLAQEQAHGTALIAASTLAFATGRLSSSDAADFRRLPY